MDEIAIAIAKRNRPSSEQVTSAVNDWLDDHPEATTTVQDGSISYAKLATDMKQTVDNFEELVIVSGTEPQEDGNKLWIEDAPDSEYSIPTYAEFSALAAAKQDAPAAAGTAGQVLGLDSNLDPVWVDQTPLDRSLSVAAAAAPADLVGELKNEIAYLQENKTNIVPLSVETYSFFIGRKEVTSFSAENYFQVSGQTGDTVLTITGERSGSTLVSNDKGAAIVIQHSSSKCRPYLLRNYTETTVTVYPPLDEDITDAIMAPYMADSQHLTIYGYQAYIQHVNEANPKHCEKNKYIKKYHPVAANTPTKFSPLGVSTSSWTYSNNDHPNISYQYGPFGTVIYPYAAYSTTGKYGARWKVDTGDYAGYLETFVGCKYVSGITIEKDQGYEMHIDVYADGTLIFQKTKDTNHVERICVDFTKDQKEIDIQIYYTTMRKNSNDSIFIGETTFWINESYPSAILPAGAAVSLLFDSWGGRGYTENVVEEATPWHSGATWPQGESGEEVKRIMKAKTGFQTPVFNTSRGSMTSRWGQAWFGTAVREKHPNIMLTEFGVNDYHTTVGGTWENISDPYGNTIVMANNPLTQSEYAQNMKNIFDMAIMNGIQPVFIETNIGGSLTWTLGMLATNAEDVLAE